MSDNSQDWRPTASLETLKLRAQLLARIRSYFAAEGVLEVETPILSTAGTTDPNLHSFCAQSLAPGDSPAPFYLHTSPEFAMKRLLAAGSGSIYQITKAFRGGELGHRHNPEFTLLEWYRVGHDYHRLMDDVDAVITTALGDNRPLQANEKLSYQEAFLRYAGINPHSASASDFAESARAHSIDVTGLDKEDVDGWRDLLLTHLVEPRLGTGRLTFLYDYPASQAALARVRTGTPSVAERFEVYLDGIELANGFHELSDAAEQRRRFESDGENRRRHVLAPVPPDRRLLAALTHGLPNCSGVALGVDRLVMTAIAATRLSDVVAFPADRA